MRLSNDLIHVIQHAPKTLLPTLYRLGEILSLESPREKDRLLQPHPYGYFYRHEINLLQKRGYLSRSRFSGVESLTLTCVDLALEAWQYREESAKGLTMDNYWVRNRTHKEVLSAPLQTGVTDDGGEAYTDGNVCVYGKIPQYVVNNQHTRFSLRQFNGSQFDGLQPEKQIVPVGFYTPSTISNRFVVFESGEVLKGKYYDYLLSRNPNAVWFSTVRTQADGGFPRTVLMYDDSSCSKRIAVLATRNGPVTEIPLRLKVLVTKK